LPLQQLGGSRRNGRIQPPWQSHGPGLAFSDPGWDMLLKARQVGETSPGPVNWRPCSTAATPWVRWPETGLVISLLRLDWLRAQGSNPQGASTACMLRVSLSSKPGSSPREAAGCRSNPSDRPGRSTAFRPVSARATGRCAARPADPLGPTRIGSLAWPRPEAGWDVFCYAQWLWRQSPPQRNPLQVLDKGHGHRPAVDQGRARIGTGFLLGPATP